MSALQVGARAPDFELKATGDTTVRLSELLKQGKHVVIAFYPAAFSPVCGDELSLFQEARDEFARLNAQVIAISVDNVWSADAFAQAKGIAFPLLADFHPKGEVRGHARRRHRRARAVHHRPPGRHSLQLRLARRGEPGG